VDKAIQACLYIKTKQNNDIVWDKKNKPYSQKIRISQFRCGSSWVVTLFMKLVTLTLKQTSWGLTVGVGFPHKQDRAKQSKNNNHLMVKHMIGL